MSETNDLTVVYYTANTAPEAFMRKVQDTLLRAIPDGVPLISISQKPIEFGINFCIGDIGRSHFNIYRQALIGAKAARTKYIALAEDDVLYSPDHFKLRPITPGFFAYNLNVWSIYTWSNPPIFSKKGRRVLHSLICERKLFIEAMEERFAKHPNPGLEQIRNWGEPGKYEKYLGVTERKSEQLQSFYPNVAFSHPTALAFGHLGTRKALGGERSAEIPNWGKASDIIKYYETKN